MQPDTPCDTSPATDEKTARQMAEDPTTPAAELERLLGRSAAINQLLARHPNIPLKLYRLLAKSHPEAAWNLTDPQRVRLSDLLKYNLQTVRAYLLKEQFRQFWDYDSPAWAAKFLDQWVALVMRSRIEPMKKVAKTLRNHRELILNYFRAKKQFSSVVVEGLNNKVKVTMRKSYGFRTFRITELALYHVLGKLPEPELTHRFY